MPDSALIVKTLGLVAVAAPASLFALLGIASLLDRKLSERVIAFMCHVAILVGLIASAAVFAFMVATGERNVQDDLGDWASVANYHFSVSGVCDLLSVPFT